jgi:hypothetical protein
MNDSHQADDSRVAMKAFIIALAIVASVLPTWAAMSINVTNKFAYGANLG